jgi:hypothetical protein
MRQHQPGEGPRRARASYATGSPGERTEASVDLQDLVARSIWQNTERLKVVANTAGMPVSFGDVLVRHTRLSETALPAPPDMPDALVVLTPACDLVRKPKGRVILVGGQLKDLDSKSWRYKSKGVTTPIVQLSGHGRMTILWDLDDQRMLNRSELNGLMGARGPYQTMVRLRESYALEIQQDLLSNMGRVGTVSKMPFTFPVDVSMSIAGTDGELKPLDLLATNRDGGVCITGRDGDGNDLSRLTLTEDSIDEILEAIPNIQQDEVHEKARDSLRRLQRSSSFKSMLRSGLRAPPAAVKGGLIPIEAPIAEKSPQAEESAAASSAPEKEKTESVALIVRNPGEIKLSTKEFKQAAVVIVLKDCEPEAVTISTTMRSDSLEDGGDPIARD